MDAASTEDAFPVVLFRRAAMASSNFTRCSSDATPSSFRFSCVKTRENRLVYVILAKCRLILFEAKASQPTSEIHGGILNPLGAHDPPGKTTCLGLLSNVMSGDLAASRLGPVYH